MALGVAAHGGCVRAAALGGFAACIFRNAFRRCHSCTARVIFRSTTPTTWCPAPPRARWCCWHPPVAGTTTQ
eukprot:2123028-Pyramimonas_sp.AAC.2